MKFRKVIAAIIITLIFISIFLLSNEQDHSTSTASSKSEDTKLRVADCEIGVPVFGKFYITNSEIDFWTGPSDNHSRVINRRATGALGKTHYRTLWPTMVLEGRCETADWLQASIIMADGKSVNWETGWVHKQFVTAEVSSDMKSGLIWNIDSEKDFTDSEKQVLRRGALKVLEDDPNCAEIITGYHSGSRTGSYYVTCNAKNGGSPFNVWFTPEALEIGDVLAVPKAYPETQSRQACEQAIRTQVLHPSTLDIYQILGYATEVHNNGSRTVIQEFSAENSFGHKLEHRARCLLQPDGTLEITITDLE